MCKQREVGESHRVATASGYRGGAGECVLLDRTTTKTHARGRHCLYTVAESSVGHLCDAKISPLLQIGWEVFNLAH